MPDRPQSIAAAPFRPSPPGIVRRRPGAARAPFLVIPDPPHGSSETDGLRCTFLLHLRPDDRGALAAVCRRIYLASLSDEAVAGRDPFSRQLLRAVGRDLRHAAWSLSIVARGDDDPKAAQFARKLGPQLKEVAERIAAEVGR